MDSVDSGNKPKYLKHRGRPKKQDAPVVDWEAVDRALVFGEKVSDSKTGIETIKYPSYKEIAQRIGLSVTRVFKYSAQRQCMQRREDAKHRTMEEYTRQVTEMRAKAQAISTSDMERISDAFIAKFEQRLGEDRVRADSPLDFERISRLKLDLASDAKIKEATCGTLTFEKLQERDANARKMLKMLDDDPGLGGSLN